MSGFKDKGDRERNEGPNRGLHPLWDHEADYLNLPHGTSIRRDSDEYKRLREMPERREQTKEAQQAALEAIEDFGEWWGSFVLAGTDDSMGLLMAQPWPIGIGDRVRYDTSRRDGDRWLVWHDKRRWVPDGLGHRIDLFRSRVAAHASWLAAAGLEEQTKVMFKYSNVTTRDHVFKDLESRSPIVVEGDYFDSDLSLIGVGNGVYDLKKGEWREGIPGDRVSMSTGIDYVEDAQCPRFISALQEVTARPDGSTDEELTDFLLLFYGYCLSGGNPEERWAQETGTGGNGKGKLKDAIEYVFGDYAVEVDSTMFMKTKHGRPTADRPNPSVLDMRHRRIVFSSEPEGEDHMLNETFIKAVSGRDRLNTRYLWSNVQIKYRWAQVIVLLTNKTLEVEDSDPAMRQRTIVFPFEQEFRGTEREDPFLLDALKLEAEGIQALLIRTAVAYRAGQWGKTPLRDTMPERATTAAAVFFDKSNVLGRWKGERLVTDLPGWTVPADLWTDYQQWYDAQQRSLGLAELPERVNSETFYRRLGQLGLSVGHPRIDGRQVKAYRVLFRDDDDAGSGSTTTLVEPDEAA